jgi:hypothetical protein
MSLDGKHTVSSPDTLNIKYVWMLLLLKRDSWKCVLFLLCTKYTEEFKLQ